MAETGAGQHGFATATVCAKFNMEYLIFMSEEDIKRQALNKNGIDLIPLGAPISKERIEKIVFGATGFIYCVSVNGITGECKRIDENIREYIESKTEKTVLLVVGISNGETVETVKEFCDGVIIGSAIIKRIEIKNSGYNDIESFMQEIRKKL